MAEVLAVARDREAGTCPLWPDGLTAAVVDAVEYVTSERWECREACDERRRAKE